MAETRSKTQSKEGVARDTDESFKTQMKHLESTVEDHRAVVQANFDDLFSTVRLLTEKVQILVNNKADSHEKFSQTNNSSFAPHMTQHDPAKGCGHNIYKGITRLTKLEFPRFSGSEIQDWLFQAEEFFEVDATPEDLKVRIAGMHFRAAAAKWHRSFAKSEEGKTAIQNWSIYKTFLLQRFDDLFENPISELKLLQETEGIVDYNEKFENIRTRVNLPEDYLVTFYLTGLRLDTQMHVQMFSPQTTRQCFTLGRIYERAHPMKLSTHKGSYTRFSGNAHKGLLPLPKDTESTEEMKTSAASQKEGVTQPRHFLSPKEMSERRAKGLCYFCDEKFTPTHYLQHKTKQLFVIEVAEDEDDSMPNEPPIVEEDEDAAQISVHAMSGVDDYRTMRVRGVHNKRTLFILLDSGSTHNFMDIRVAEKLGCRMQKSGQQNVTVADGTKLNVKARIAQFEWSFQGVPFKADFMVIPLGSYDMVLGIQWLQELGPITWDFKKLEMHFRLNNRKLILHGMQQGSVREVKAISLNKKMDTTVELAMICGIGKSEGITAELCAADLQSPQVDIPAILNLKSEFAAVFEVPTTLPPQRPLHDHRIPLLEGSNPINQRPYRYDLQKKREIDVMVQELLDQGTIQPSTSPYASPVVLVKKKDGGWRLCVDYRSLNQQTIKDSFPIPLIEDLMDELGGSIIFSKIDLRAGYHQVRMASSDIYKTAFKTHTGHYEYLVMPFGLTNAPATFQGLMNSVFKPFLRSFVLIFFDDILVYSPSLDSHLTHLRSVFQVMQENNLYAKASKCLFATPRVEYLGHFIQASGISTDPSKVQAIANWSIPVNLKQLRGFLGLAGYYRRFVKHFGIIASPLTALTKKDSFVWSLEAQKAFDALKAALCSTPVLALPAFDKPFIVETDACGHGIGAVLMQEGHPLAYISRHLKVQKWRHYLLTGHFVIKTDQRSLKYLLEQRLNTPIQQQWLPKLLEFDYEIQYKQGKENVAADALSRMEGAEILHMAMTVSESDLLQQIQNGYEQDSLLKDLIAAVIQDPDTKKHFTWSQGILRRKGKIVVPNLAPLRNSILEWLHGSSSSGHSGRDVTFQRVKGLFYWRGMANDIQAFIRACMVCQQCKYETVSSPGLLQPLSIPNAIWSDISMDFIEGLPPSSGKSVILVVVDRLSKAAHFIALSHPYSAVTVAHAFIDNVYKLHGLPQSIVSDRDTVFLSNFWQELFKAQGVALNMSSAYHPQSDGQSEVVNRCLETYLRCMTSDRPTLWSSWLSLAEYWYNTNFHTATQVTPFEVVYGRPPPIHLPYLPGESKTAMVTRSLQDRENMILMLKFHLRRAQHRMKQNADKHRTERTFEVGTYVFVKLQPYRQKSVVSRSNNKLSPKYFGPYKILAKYGTVAYKLELPPSSRIHPVFHVSQLKILVGNVQTANQIPDTVQDVFSKEPEEILERKMVNRHGRAVTMILVKWKHQSADDATWELFYDILKKYPQFEP